MGYHKIWYIGIFLYPEGGAFEFPYRGFGLYIDHGKLGFQIKVMFYKCIFKITKINNK